MPTAVKHLAASAARIGHAVALACYALAILYSFLHFDSINFLPHAAYADMVYGKAWKPFVYRTLLPTTVRAIASPIPSAARHAFNQDARQITFVSNEFQLMRWDLDYVAEYALGVLLMYGSLLGFVMALHFLLTSLYDAPDWFARAVQFAALAGIPPLFHYINYVYDFTTLFLFTLGLALMVRRRWPAFLAVYALACLNKETTILLTMIFALHFVRHAGLDRALYGRLIVAQLAIFSAIKLALGFIFRANPGSFVEFHLDHTIELLSGHASLTNFIIWLVIALLVFHQWLRKPAFLRRGALILIPLLILTAFLGFLDELRDYYEVYPIVVLLIAHTAASLIGIPLVERPEGGSGPGDPRPLPPDHAPEHGDAAGLCASSSER